MVSVLAFYSANPSLNFEYLWLLIFFFQKDKKIKEKEAEDGPFKKNNTVKS